MNDVIERRKSKKCECDCDCKRYIRLDRYSSLPEESQLCMTCEVRKSSIKAALETLLEYDLRHTALLLAEGI